MDISSSETAATEGLTASRSVLVGIPSGCPVLSLSYTRDLVKISLSFFFFMSKMWTNVLKTTLFVVVFSVSTCLVASSV